MVDRDSSSMDPPPLTFAFQLNYIFNIPLSPIF